MGGRLGLRDGLRSGKFLFARLLIVTDRSHDGEEERCGEERK